MKKTVLPFLWVFATLVIVFAIPSIVLRVSCHKGQGREYLVKLPQKVNKIDYDRICKKIQKYGHRGEKGITGLFNWEYGPSRDPTDTIIKYGFLLRTDDGMICVWINTTNIFGDNRHYFIGPDHLYVWKDCYDEWKNQAQKDYEHILKLSY